MSTIVTMQIDDEDISRIVKRSLEDSLEYESRPKLQRAMERTLAYYMTYPETVERFGKKKADKYWRD